MLSVEEIRADRPIEVLRARMLTIVVVVLWLPVVGYLYPTDTAGLPLLAMFGCLWGAFGVAKGRQAARIMATISLGIACLFVLPACWISLGDPTAGAPALAIVDVVSILLSVYVLVLMFRPDSNRYVHLITVARAQR